MSRAAASNLHIAWARLFLRALAASGVRDLVLSPGSRSTPLALAAAESAELRTHVIVDERAAAFFALGQARVSGVPSALVCTSGTAGAHYLPAIIEAAESFVPLLAITADRPWELQSASAPQTIDQVKLFGGFVRHFADLGLPDPSPTALAAVPRIAAQAVASALGPTPGPVHLNARFRKPLEPVSVEDVEPWTPTWEALMTRGAPKVRASIAPGLDDVDVDAVRDQLVAHERGLIVVGPGPLASAALRSAVFDLAGVTGFPVLAEATSQLRFGSARPEALRVSSFDALFRVPDLRARFAAHVILEIGAPPISAGYAQLLAEHPRCRRVVLAPHGWNDPTSTADELVVCDPARFLRRLVARWPTSTLEISRRWSATFARADVLATRIAECSIAGEALTEGAIAAQVLAACPEGSILAIGNSTPVRDLDAYCPASDRDVRVLHQRGASGIDGLVAGAAGAASAADVPVTLLLGDVSLRHDLTSLGLLRAVATPERAVVAVVVQNGGGRIFDHLPIAGAPGAADAFERFFATPDDVRFDHAAAAFGLAFARVDTRSGLVAALDDARSRGGATLIEAIAPPREGARRLRDIWAELRREIARESV